MRRGFNGNYLMIFFLIIMVVNSIRSGRYDSPGQWLFFTLISLPGIVIGITFHEFAHAYSAWKLGDQTPMAQKRVTLNPLAHIDPIGIIALVFVGFGWGRPVQVNPYVFKKNRRLANLIIDVAGVVTNLIIAFICTALLVYIQNSATGGGIGVFVLYNIVYFIVYFNIVLMLFNLIPIPPLDGFGIITEIFDLRRQPWYRTFYNYGSIILLFLIMMRFIALILVPAVNKIMIAFETVWSIII